MNDQSSFVMALVGEKVNFFIIKENGMPVDCAFFFEKLYGPKITK